MPEIEPIIEIARGVLTGRSPLGKDDTFLFDHSLRVMRVADRLSLCAEVKTWRMDRFALSVAALFHQAALVRLDEERRTSTVYAAATMSAEDVKSYSAELAGDRLLGKVPARPLELVQDIIRHAHDAGPETPEAQVLSDADSLDDVGALGVWRDLRRAVLDGRAVEEFTHAWARREQYGYWKTRVRDAFYLETARQLAEGRLASARAFMEQLATECNAADLPSEEGGT
jgi:uncharacterized protein